MAHNVVCVEVSGGVCTLGGHPIHSATQALYLWGEHVVHRVRDEHHAAVRLGCPLQTGGHVDVGAEVGGVDLENRPNGTLDAVPRVQAQPKLGGVAGHAVLHLLAVCKLLELGVVGRLHDNAHKGAQGGVGGGDVALAVAAVGEGPRHEEGVADVLVRGALVLLDGVVDEHGDAVDKVHDVDAEALGTVGEVADVAEPENGVDALARNDGVDVRRVRAHVGLDDGGAGVAKPNLEHTT
mmetsp:Transcript_7567/g.16764  ORF Transcript_7567/g.16764 Transcript_7567/m.16764 type:complete len:238 (-) Transcript_7567:1501-2214(-)